MRVAPVAITLLALCSVPASALNDAFSEAELSLVLRRAQKKDCTSACSLTAANGDKFDLEIFRPIGKDGIVRWVVLVTQVNPMMCGSAGCTSAILTGQKDKKGDFVVSMVGPGLTKKHVEEIFGTVPNDTAAKAENKGAAIQQADCKLHNEFAERGSDIRWTGECKDGLAHGIGAARWYKNSVLNLEIAYTRSNGLIRSKGNAEIVREVIAQKIRLTPQSCDRSAGYRSVRVDADPSLALHHNFLMTYIINERAQRLAWEHCPSNNYSNVAVEIYAGNQNVISARSYPPVEGPSNVNKTNWAEFNNRAQREYLSKFDRMFEQTSAAFQQAERRRAQENAQQQAALKQKAENESRNAAQAKFTSQFGVQGFVGRQELIANPFLFKGKTVATHAYFKRMTSENEALFGTWVTSSTDEFIVSKVSPSQFSRAETQVILALKVLGMKPVSGPNQPQIPHVELVGIYYCGTDGCRDFGRIDRSGKLY